MGSPILSGTVAKGDTFKEQSGNIFCITNLFVLASQLLLILANISLWGRIPCYYILEEIVSV